MTEICPLCAECTASRVDSSLQLDGTIAQTREQAFYPATP